MPIIEGAWVTKPTGVSDEYQRSAGDAAKEVGRQLVGGAVVDLPRMVGQGLRWISPPGSQDDQTGQEMVQDAGARALDYQPHDTGSGVTGRTLSMGARAVAPMVPAVAASLIPGVGEVAAPAVAGMLFGTSSAQDTKDKIAATGASDEDSTAAGYASGLIQGPLEAVGTHFGAAAFRAGRAAISAPTMDAVVTSLTSGGIKAAAKGIGTAMVVEPVTEVAQDLGTEAVERSYGAQPQSMLDIAKSSAQGAVGLTALLGPLAAGAHVSQARQSHAINTALNDPSAPLEARSMAEQIVAQHAAEAGVPQDQIDAWHAAREAGAPAPAGPANLLAGGAPMAEPEASAAPAEVAPQAAIQQPVQQTTEQSTPQATQVAEMAAAPAAPGVDPAIAAQQAQQDQVAQAQQAEQQAQQSRVEEHKARIVAEQQATAQAEDAIGGTERDDKGKRTVKVPGRYVDTYREAKALADAGSLTPEAFQNTQDRLIAALQTNDNKTLQAVRKGLDELRTPAPIEAPAVAKEAVAEAAPAEKAKPEATVKETPRVAEPVPQVTANTAVAAATPATYEQYAGKPVTILVPQEGGKKPLRRTIKDAKASLEEAESRASMYEELVRCITK